MEQKKILILYNKLFHYRIPIFNILAQKYDLTVSYSYKPNVEDLKLCNFKTNYLPVRQKGRFTFHEDNLLSYCNNFDVVIAYGQITWLDVAKLARNKKRNFKIAFWGIGVSASYNRKYDDGNFFVEWIYDLFRKKADSNIFYTDYPIEKYKKRGFSQDSLFVANNTVEIEKINLVDNKSSILFIGTLYMEKGLKILLESYQEAFLKNNYLPTLKIIGGGNEFDKINQWIVDNKMEQNIILLGPIFESKKKATFFKNALACISPNQAGLSVLESMGYGVPFITYNDAITGGESFNIIDNVNGRRLGREEQLKNVILDIASNKSKYIEMGKLAYDHYWACRKPNDMARGLSDAIKYMLNK